MTDISRVIEELRALRAKAGALTGTERTMYSSCECSKCSAAKDLYDACVDNMPAILAAYEAAVADGAALRSGIQGALMFNDQPHSDPLVDLCSMTGVLEATLASPSSGQKLLEERDRLREQLEAAMQVVLAIDDWVSADHGLSKSSAHRLAVSTALRNCRRDHPDLFGKGGS